MLVGVLCLSVTLFVRTEIGEAADAPAAELFTDTPLLQPTSTLEIRFARPMVSSDDVGLSPKEAPITITPPIPGTFTWLSRSSGVFVPEVAWPLASEYRVSLKQGLKAADGKPIGAIPSPWTLRTPPFSRTALQNGVYDAEDVPARPSVKLAFNLAVDLKSAAPLFQFIDAKGRKVDAKVRYATRRDYFSLQPEQDDWERRWLEAKGKIEKSAAEDEQETEEQPETPEDTDTPPANIPPQSNRLVVTPSEPLTPGAAWRLEMKGGLTSQSGKYRIAEPLTVPLGEVKPFQVTSVQASNYINSGRTVVVEFSRAMAEDITAETAPKFFRIEPAVANLRFDGGYTSLTAHGDFERDRDYRLVMEPTVVSMEGFPPESGREYTFRFGPVAPRLYLPEITGHQIRSGQRKFDVLSANLKTLHVTARLIAPDQVARAVAAFEKYEAEESGDELYQKLPDQLVRGKVIHDRVIDLAGQPIDSRQQTSLNWDEILGQQKAGAILLTVEGTPLPEVAGKRPGAQALIQLTDIGVLWKKVEEGLRVTAFSMANGQPMEGAKVALLNNEFGRGQNASTDHEGNATVPLGKEPGWLMVARGDDTFALRVGAESHELPMAAFRVPIEYSEWEQTPEAALQLRGFIFTDRPLYRPGETVHVKGIVRRVDAAGLAAGGGLTGQLKLREPRGREAVSIDIQTDEHGAFDTEIKLASTVVGEHSIQLSFPDAPNLQWQKGFVTSFQVTDFQPNAFELNVAMPDRLAAAAPVHADVTAKYFFGAPLTKADVRWTLQYARETFSPEGFTGWQFGTDEGASGRTLTLRGEGSLNGPGALAIDPQLSAVKDAPHKGVLTVEATDINQQTVSESRVFARDASEFYIGVAVPEGAVFRPGGEIAAKAVAVRPNGQPLDRPVDVTAELIHARNDTVRVQGAGKAISFRTEKTETVVAQTAGRTLMPAKQGDTWEAREGASATFKAPGAGQYRIRITAKDSAGNVASSTMPVYVSGPEELAWDYRNPAQIELVADKQEYRPGDTARLLVKTPISGEALVSIERGQKILRTQRVRLEGNAPTIDVPLSAADAPNVFVSLTIIRGLDQSTRKFKTAEYRYGIAMLRVTDPAARLQVGITPSRPHLQPGEELETEVIVRNGIGAAVPDAEVTLYAVDDGILALTGYERPAPDSVFGAPFPLAIRTGLTLFDVLPEDPAELEFSNKGYLIGGGGLEGPGLKLRRNFPGTACWFPNLRTDRDGKVRVSFKVPDALTRYRLVAVAHAGTQLFGSGESAFTIRKSLMILPALGQFANVGDELIARAVIRNDSGADGVVDVSLQTDATAEPLRPGAEGTRTRIELKNGDARAVDFPVRLREMGNAEWRWSARIDAGGQTFEDRVVSALSVGSAAPVLRETYLTDLNAKENNLLAGVNPQLLEGTGAVAVTVANTRLASLRESASYLLEYPYGCAEQIMSSLIPWMLTKELRPVFPALAKPETEVESTIRDGMDRVFAMQTPSGGIAMWPSEHTPSLFISAYAALGCSLLADRQTAPPPGFDSLLKYLSNELRGTSTVHDERALSDRILALYALAAAGQAEPAYHEEMFRRRKELPRESRALLALAIQASAGPGTMIEQLLDPRAAAPESFSFYGGAARERAIQLLASSRCKPRSPEVAKLVKELLAHRYNGHWGTTQQNAWALLGLARYYSAVEAGAKPGNGTLVASGREFPIRVNAQTPAATNAFVFSPSEPLANLSLSKDSAGPLFGETRFIVRPPVATQPRQDRGYSVSRNYRKLADDGSLQDATELKVGDRILVTLRVETARPGHFVAIDDPLPAVLEALNPAFRSKEVGGGETLTRAGMSDHQEVRADRVLYFCDHLAPGSYTFTYLARVRSAGTVTAGSTKVEEMYRPERFGLSETAKLVARLAEER